jgi:hypothetical protein
MDNSPLHHGSSGEVNRAERHQGARRGAAREDEDVKIQTVTYSRLVSGPGYSNQTIGATAVLEPEDSPEAALTQLERWVNDEFGQREQLAIDARNASYELSQAQHQLMVIADQLEVAQRRWEAVKKLSEALGVDLHSKIATLDEVPF